MFPTTRRSVIAALASENAEQRRRAFDTFVALYWKPLYKYLRVARGREVADAEDSTQAFLAKCFENGSLTARLLPSCSRTWSCASSSFCGSIVKGFAPDVEYAFGGTS
jgi:hypothetical protein